MKNSIKILTLLMFVSFFSLEAQDNNGVLDGIFIKETNPTRRVIPYTHIREADVDYYKRVWREIDVREKMNHPLYYPTQPIKEIGYVRMNLFDILRKGVEEGTLTAFEREDFQVTLSKSEAMERLVEISIVFDEDIDTGELIEVEVKSDITGANITKFWIKEDWVFDRERSVMEVRIIGILPIVNEYNEDGSIKAPKPTFWIYYPEARFVLANHEVYNNNNDGSRLTFEDLFRKRIFSSYIIRETNVYDNRILSDYVKGVDRLLEARKIEQEVINYEHDLWQY